MIRFIFLFFITYFMVGCSRDEEKTYAWREEILLPSGNTVVARRTEVVGLYRELGYSEPRVRRSTVELETEVGLHLPTLEVNERPIVVGYDGEKGQWFVITNIALCEAARSAGLGNRPYLKYSLLSQGWQRSSVDDAHVGLEANMLIDKSVIEGQSLISVAEKATKDRSNSIPIYLRQVMPSVAC